MNREIGGEVVPWPHQAEIDKSHLRHRLEGVIAIFRAIDAGELLAALPECEIAQAHHRIAMNLLCLAERELVCLCNEDIH